MNHNSVLKLAPLRNTLRRDTGTCLVPDDHHWWLHQHYRAIRWMLVRVAKINNSF